MLQYFIITIFPYFPGLFFQYEHNLSKTKKKLAVVNGHVYTTLAETLIKSLFKNPSP